MNSQFQVRKYFTSFRNCTQLKEIAEFANGRKLVFETGSYAKLADGSAVATLGNTSVLVTSVSKVRPGPTPSFMPLTVDYRQKYAAAGRIPSNFLRRELAPTEKEILTSRVIDRSLRPLFPSSFLHDTQLTCQLLAVDGRQEPDVVSINAASASLAVSSIPWNGPIGAVRLGFIDGELVTFPTRKELSHSSLNIIITASSKDHIVMLEGSANIISPQNLKKAIRLGVKECQKVIDSINLLCKKKSREKKSYTPPPVPSEEVEAATRSLSSIKLREILRNVDHDKLSRDNAINSLRLEVVQNLGETFTGTDTSFFNDAFNKVTKEEFRSLILKENIRCDGRDSHELRPITCSVNLFEPLHGSSLFQRGQTQVQCTVAYDSPDKALKVDPLLEVTGGLNDRNFLLHYSFPSYANNELSRGGPTSRREIGHGALAAKGLKPVLPNDNSFCILLSSTVMESNGSSSMATVCGGSLALMDAGVNISTHAAGVAIGLITEVDDQGQVVDYRLLTDILGIEDYLGDMDFKVAGTKDGITALQADIKVPGGLNYRIIMEAIDRAMTAKRSILKIMNKTISEPQEGKENLPLVITKEIPPHKRAAIIGPGGVQVKRMQAESGVQFTFEEGDKLSLFAPNKDSMDEALQFIEGCLQSEPELEFGAIYNAKIVEIRSQGVMITLYDGMKPTLLHNSQLDVKKINHPSVLNLEEGDEIKVKYFGRDPTSGLMRVSRRALQVTVPTSKNLIRNENS